MVLVREREEVGEWEALLEQPQTLLHHGDVGGRVARLPVVHARHEEVLAHDGFQEGDRNPGAFGQLGECEELLRGLRVGARDRGGERRVGRIEIAGEDTADEREREALSAQLPHPEQPIEVLGPVPGDPSGALGRRQEAALLVEADRVDGKVGPPGQVLHPPALARLGRHEH